MGFDRHTPRRAIALGLALAGWVAPARAQNHMMPAAAPGLVESGVPPFIVYSPGTLGLGSTPTDIHALPDGRMLLVAAQEIAIGDGTRWEAFRRHPETSGAELTQVLVDDAGRIFASAEGAFARVDLGEDGTWRFAHVAPFPGGPNLAGRVLSRAFAARGEWYWHGGNGALVAWQPGRAAQVIGTMNDLDRPFFSGDRVYIGDTSTGTIYRIAGHALETVDAAETRKLDRAVVCGITLDDGRTLVGTQSLGVQVFDRGELRPLVSRGLLAGPARVVDLCAVGEGYHAAALDNMGLAFFDSAGRVVQVLDRSVDHRLARVRRLRAAPGGEVWALLNEGLAIVRFPARVSNFEPLVSTGLNYAIPTRHEGRLWLYSDGLAHRGVYDDTGRLLRFEIDSPGPWVSTVQSTGGRLLLATAAGVYLRDGDEWRLVAGDLPNAHLGLVPGEDHRWIVVGHDEVAWLRAAGDRFTTEKFPAPGMGSSFGSVLHAEGAYWAELGASRMARIVVRADGGLETQLIGRDDGWPDGWVQAFVIDERIRFNVAGRVFRYDSATGRVVPDADFLAHTPELLGAHGRPMRDARGRLWLATDHGVRVIDERAGPEAGTLSQELLPPAFTPIGFAMEPDGTVWMHQRARLLRFDPALPATPPAPLRAVIGHVRLANTGRSFHFPGPQLPDLDYADNSITAHVVAPHTVFGAPVNFEVMLEGAGASWVPTGPAGTASFTRLPEGRYVLQVRPRVGEATGAPATLAFVIRPPWFRTPLAYTLYAVAAAGLVWLGAFAWSLLARRKAALLARVVAERTAELRDSEEHVRKLNEELEERVATRTGELNLANTRLVESNRELEAFSYSVSHDLRAPLRNINGFAELLRKRAAGRIDAETDRYLAIVSQESIRLGQLIDALLVFSRLNRAELRRTTVEPGRLISSVRAELTPASRGRHVEWRVGPLPSVAADATLLRQVFLNLLENALKFTRNREHAVIEIGAAAPAGGPPGETVLYVRDNGAGFDPKYTDKLFGVFQRLHSAREYEGSGIGLATVRRVVERHGGRVWAEGIPGAGATFFIGLPDSSKPAQPDTKAK